MNLEKLREGLKRDEGCEYKIYNDPLGYSTFGIGHLITENDPEHGQSLGTEVSENRVIEAFESDVETVIKDCKVLYYDFHNLPEEVQRIIANMMFNMGRTRLSKFREMKSGVSRRDWNDAADEMVDSIWYRQVTNRANRLVERMRNV